jgi:DNA-binding NtrC family response regulator
VIVAEMLRRRGFPDTPVEGPGADLLRGHDWPGNVRELRNVIDRALALSPGARTFAALRLATDGVVGAEAPPVAVATELPWHEAKALALHGFERRRGLGDHRRAHRGLHHGASPSATPQRRRADTEHHGPAGQRAHSNTVAHESMRAGKIGVLNGRETLCVRVPMFIPVCTMFR